MFSGGLRGLCVSDDRGVVAFGSLRCSLYDGSASVALRVDNASYRLLFGLCLSPPCNLACVVVAFSMCMRVLSSGVASFSSIGVQSLTLLPTWGPSVSVAYLST